MKALDDDEDTQARNAKGSKDDSGKGGDEDDDDSDEEMRGKSASAVARRRERARCASIFACAAAGANPALAAHLAFNTTMTRSEAIGTLKATPAGRCADPVASRPIRAQRAQPERVVDRRHAEVAQARTDLDVGSGAGSEQLRRPPPACRKPAQPLKRRDDSASTTF